MIKDITYKGYSAVPSDYQCPDGDLALSINLLNEDGALHQLSSPALVADSPAGYKLVFTHKTPTFSNYIFLGNSFYGWSRLQDSGFAPVSTLLTLSSSIEIQQITSVGNTLIFLTSSGLHYFLFKDSGYIDLGTQLPFPHLSFGLKADLQNSGDFDISFDIEKDNGVMIQREFDTENKIRITNQVLAKVNQFIVEKAHKKGRFIYPFFVRYALRLYDGTLTRHSAPILMLPSSDCAPLVGWKSIHASGDKFTSATMDVFAPVSTLDYALVSDKADFDNYKDIISSIDIFISAPIYTYDQSGEIKGGFKTQFSSDQSFFIGKATGGDDNRYRFTKICDLYSRMLSRQPQGILQLPAKSQEAIFEDIRNCSLFYLIDSIKIDDLATQRTEIGIKEDLLATLTVREVMTDDYLSHHTLIPSTAYNYNSRLNLAGIKLKLFGGFPPQCALPFTNGAYDLDGTPDASTTPFTLYFRIRRGGKDITVCAGSSTLGAPLAGITPIPFIFYPDPNAYEAILVTDGHYPYGTIRRLPLTPHATLNGAFYFDDWTPPAPSHGITISLSQGDSLIVRESSKIFTSEVNNPFFFPLRTITSLGSASINYICAAARALSEGQFGQFPLYAFTDQGIWALEVSSSGSYSARQPITRDVILANTLPLQMDTAVLFATDRGIMLISGSHTQCISDVVNSREPFDVSQLPAMPTLHSMLGHNADTCLPTAPFLDFIAECGMLYDYVHQRVIIYNPHYTYAYVYSLKSKEWGMMYSTIRHAVNSYPRALAVIAGNSIVDFAGQGSPLPVALLLTRPIKLDSPDTLKTVSSVIQRGNFHKGAIRSLLYASRDLIHWHLLWSSKDHYLRGFRGTPYKYFRIAGVATLDADESIYGASVQFTPRLTNQSR